MGFVASTSGDAPGLPAFGGAAVGTAVVPAVLAGDDAVEQPFVTRPSTNAHA
jgi:hypothetical protein